MVEGSSSVSNDSSVVMDSKPPEAEAILTSSSEDTNESSKDGENERADSDVLRQSMVPKWLQDLEHNMEAAAAATAAKSDNDSSSTNIAGGTTKSTDSSNNSVFSASSSRRDSMVAPDWLKEFEQEQKKLLDALTRDQSTRSLLGGGLGASSRHRQRPVSQDNYYSSDEEDDNAMLEPLPGTTAVAVATLDDDWESAPPLPTPTPSYEPPPPKKQQQQQQQLHRDSVTPEWLLGFEAEQKKLLQAMKDPQTANKFQDSFAMMEDDELELMVEEAGVQQQQQPPPKQEEEAEEEQIITPTNSGAVFEEEKKECSPAYTKNPATTTTTAAPNNRRASASSLVVPDWLVEFENQQNQLFQMLDRRASTMPFGESSLSQLNAELLGSNNNASPKTKRQSSMMINTPDWLKDFENQQKELLDELHSMNHQSSIHIKTTNLEKSGILLSEEEEEEEEEEEDEEEDEEAVEKQIVVEKKMDLEPARSDGTDTMNHSQNSATEDKEYDSIPDPTEPEQRQPARSTSKLELAAAAAAVAKAKKMTTPEDAVTSANTSKKQQEEKQPADDHPGIQESKSLTLEDLEDNKKKEISPLASTVTTNQLEAAKGQLATTKPSATFKGHNRPTEYQNFKLRKTPPRPINTNKKRGENNTPSDPDSGVKQQPPTATKNEFQKFQLRKISPTVAQRNIAESKLQFAELVAKAITPRNYDDNNNNSNALVKKKAVPGWSEALRHMDDLKEQVTHLQNLERDQLGSSWAQINKLHESILKVYDTGEDSSNLWQNWLLPLRPNRGSVAMKFGFLADADAEQLAKLKQEEWDQAGGMGIVKKVLELNFKAIHGPNCLQTIHDYAMLKFGKKKRKERNDGWQALLAKLFEDAEKAKEDGEPDEDVHLRVRNSLVQWVVREILYTSRDTVSSKMCFHATYLIAMLKLELQRLAPSVLEQQQQSSNKSTSAGAKSATNTQQQEGAFGFKKESVQGGCTGRLVDAPDIVKKLLNRQQSDASQSPTGGGPSDLPPELRHAGSGSEDKVDFVRETINDRTEEDTMEEKARIKSRASTFVRMEPKEMNDMDESRVSDAVRSYKPPTDYDLVLQELMTNTSRKSSLSSPPAPQQQQHRSSKPSKEGSVGHMDSSNRTNGSRLTKCTDTASSLGKPGTISKATAATEKDQSTENNAADAEIDTTSQKEDETDLPLPVQDAHRVIRTILGPAHPNITVSLCFEALRVYAALIDGWRDVDADAASAGADNMSTVSKPTPEESRVKSLEGGVFKRRGDGAALPATVIHITQKLEEEKKEELQRQEEEEKSARLAIAKKREEKKKHRKQRAKKGHRKGPMSDNSEMSHLSNESGSTSRSNLSPVSSPSTPRSTRMATANVASSPGKPDPLNRRVKPTATRKTSANSPSPNIDPTMTSSPSKAFTPVATPNKVTSVASSPNKPRPASSHSKKPQEATAKKQATSNGDSSLGSSPTPMKATSSRASSSSSLSSSSRTEGGRRKSMLRKLMSSVRKSTRRNKNDESEEYEV